MNVLVPTVLRLFLVFALLAGGAARAQSEHRLVVEGLPDSAPFQLQAFGYDADLRLRFSLDPEWHMFRRDVGGGQPITLHVDEHGDFSAAGPLQGPEPADGKLEGPFDVWLPVRRTGEGRFLAATLELQVCDALMCLAPMRIAIHGEVRPLEVLLVVDEIGARSGRIESWLADRGFTPRVSVYGATTARDCDTADVVLADSPVFGKMAKTAFPGARDFPRTDTPIVGVGFLATELFEAHGLAMTSGYI